MLFKHFIKYIHLLRFLSIAFFRIVGTTIFALFTHVCTSANPFINILWLRVKSLDGQLSRILPTLTVLSLQK